jgi:ABC-2 type transport system permease protein
MRNILLIIKHEIACTIGKPVFWLTTFILPIVIMAFSLGAQFISMQAFVEEPDIFNSEGQAGPPLAIGYVDQAGIIHNMPEGIPTELILQYPDETAAQLSMDAGQLSHYYVIDADYMATGKLLVVGKEFSPLGDITTMDLFQYIITYNLTGNSTLAGLFNAPIKELNAYTLDIEQTGTVEEEDDATRFIVGFGVLFILFMILTMSSGFMLRSVSQEKENRTVEVLLVSIKARELILGKIAGLGLVALLQMAIWFGGSGLILHKSNPLLKNLGIILTQGLSLPRGFVFWAVIYLLLGYILYASILGAIGALAPNTRETGQFTFIALLPLMIPMWLNSIFVQSPNGDLATILSLFPLTAPTSMLPRIASGNVPIWQPVVSVLGLAVTTYLFVMLAARFFRADTLLSSASLNLKRLREEFKKKV